MSDIILKERFNMHHWMSVIELQGLLSRKEKVDLRAAATG